MMDLTRHRISRRRFMVTLGAGGLGLLAGCAPSPAPPTAAPTAPAKPTAAAEVAGATARPTSVAAAGVLTVGMLAEATSMNPGQQPDQNTERIHSNIFDTLVAYDEQFNLQPSLATSWDVAPDGTSVVFHLRRGVRFHDGSPLDSAAVKFTFDRMLDSSNPFFTATGPYPFAEFYYGTIASIETPDDATVVFKLERPDSVLLSNLTYTTGSIVSPEAFKQFGPDVARNPVGSGPFKFVEWRSGVGVTLEANPDYWDGAPRVSRVVFRPILEQQARIIELLSGGVNFIVDVPPDNIAQIQGDPNFKVDIQPGPHVWWLALNMEKPPFNDLRVRQAANLAVNKKSIADNLLKGTATPAIGSSLPPAIAWAHNPDVAKYDYDPDRARQLLREAGFADGMDIVMWVPVSGSGMQSPREMATAVQADLQAVGIRASIQTSEWGAYLQTYQSGLADQADMAAMSWMVATGDPDILYYPTLHGASWSPAGFNTGHYKNDTVDRLVQEARQVSDRNRRADLYKQVQELVANDAPWLLIDYGMQTAAMARGVEGITLHPSFLLYFKDATVS